MPAITSSYFRKESSDTNNKITLELGFFIKSYMQMSVKGEIINLSVQRKNSNDSIIPLPSTWIPFEKTR